MSSRSSSRITRQRLASAWGVLGRRHTLQFRPLGPAQVQRRPLAHRSAPEYPESIRAPASIGCAFVQVRTLGVEPFLSPAAFVDDPVDHPAGTNLGAPGSARLRAVVQRRPVREYREGVNRVVFPGLAEAAVGNNPEWSASMCRLRLCFVRRAAAGTGALFSGSPRISTEPCAGVATCGRSSNPSLTTRPCPSSRHRQPPSTRSCKYTAAGRCHGHHQTAP